MVQSRDCSALTFWCFTVNWFAVMIIMLNSVARVGYGFEAHTWRAAAHYQSVWLRWLEVVCKHLEPTVQSQINSQELHWQQLVWDNILIHNISIGATYFHHLIQSNDFQNHLNQSKVFQSHFIQSNSGGRLEGGQTSPNCLWESPALSRGPE